MSTEFKSENAAESDIDDTKGVLMGSIELMPIKYLNGDDGCILNDTAL